MHDNYTTVTPSDGGGGVGHVRHVMIDNGVTPIRSHSVFFPFIYRTARRIGYLTTRTRGKHDDGPCAATVRPR